MHICMKYPTDYFIKKFQKAWYPGFNIFLVPKNIIDVALLSDMKMI